MNGRSILLVEDDADSAEALVILLEMQGYEVRLATSCHGAWTLLSESLAADRLPDLMIVDLMLPDGDGVELVEHLAKAGPVPPVILHSAAPENVLNAAGRRIGAMVLRKPTDWDRLMVTVREVTSGVHSHVA